MTAGVFVGDSDGLVVLMRGVVCACFFFSFFQIFFIFSFCLKKKKICSA